MSQKNYKRYLTYPTLILFFLLSTFPVYSLKDIAIVHNIRYFSSEDYTRVVVDVNKPVKFNEQKLIEKGRTRIYFDILNSRLANIPDRFIINKGYLKEIRIAQFRRNIVRVVLEFKEIQKYNIFSLQNPFRIIIDIFGEEFTRPSIPSIPSPTEKKEYSMARQLGLGVKKIVIDPGHGGHDPGAIGLFGLKEKEIVLDIALKIKKLIEKNLDIDVIITRNKDNFIPLEERTAKANSEKADLFISIHANSSRNKNRNGFEIYTLNFTTDPDAIDVAARENAVSTKSIGELENILKKIILNSKLSESQGLAKMIHKSMENNAFPVPKGLKQAPFYVLIGAEMPSILVEVAYLSNARDAALLRKPSEREKIASGIYNGILEYLKSLGKV
ncbi:MAG: N-acetylmuramoyl-L-alanine amidase [Acidobacteriota bacterium]